jgi:soluble lytic murein transglycosylase
MRFDATADVTLGAAYLKELLDRYGGALGVSLAAYNAGPVPVARWLPPRSMPADVWIENIPYGETRTYIQRVLEHIVAFAWVRDAQPPRITSLLPEIDPAVATAQRAPNTSNARDGSKKLQRLGQNSIKSRGAITGRE